MGRAATLKVDIITDAKKAQSGMSSASKGFAAVGKAAGALGLALGAAEIGKKVIQFAKDSVKAASDLEQSMGAVESVFKTNSRVIVDWAKKADKALGLSQAEAQQMAAVFGAQLQGLGFDLKQSTKLTQDLTARAADMAATFGGTTAEAIEAVGSLLRGERDPIEKYGVSIKDADIKAQLAAKGLSGLTGAAKKQAEANAALTIMMNKTASSAGAFTRESKTLAGQQQRLTAQFQNAKAAIGTALMPAIMALVNWISTKLVPVIRDAWNWFNSKLVPVLKRQLTPAVKDLKRAFTDLMAGFRSLGISGDDLKLVLKAVMTAGVLPLIAAIRTVSSLCRAWASAFRTVAGAVGNVVDAVQSLVSWLGRIKTPHINWPKPPGWLTAITPLSVAPVRAPSATGVSQRAAGPSTRQASAGITINVQGALDPDAVARQIRAILAGHARRVGMT